MSDEKLYLEQCMRLWSDIYAYSYKESGSTKRAAIHADMAVDEFSHTFAKKCNREIN